MERIRQGHVVGPHNIQAWSGFLCSRDYWLEPGCGGTRKNILIKKENVKKYFLDT